MFKGMLLDLDGTLADTLESLAVSCNRGLEQCGLPTQPVEAFKQFAGDGPPTLVRKAITAAGDTEGKYYAIVMKAYQETLKDYNAFPLKTFDGMKEALIQIKNAGGLLGVITNKPQDRAKEVVDTLFGKDFFDIVIGFSENFPRKPDPSSTKYAMEHLQISPKECIYVGDTDVDMKTGKGAGAYTVGVLWGFRGRTELENHGADRIISHPSELVEIWKNIK